MASFPTRITAARTGVLLAFCLLLGSCLIRPTTDTPEVSSQALVREQNTQYAILLEEQFRDEARVARVGYKVLRAGAGFCRQLTRVPGFLYVDQLLIPQNLWPAANRLWGMGAYPKVIEVFANSPAERAGLKSGDTIVGFGDQTSRMNKDRASLKGFREYMLKNNQPEYHFRVLRQGQEFTLPLSPDQLCNYPVNFSSDDTVNAYADGARIVVLKGLVNFVRSDDELALIIAHELAHNIESHVEAQQVNSTVGFMLGIAFDSLLGTGYTFQDLGYGMGALSHSASFEREADYIGMYILAHTDYDIEAVPKLWRRMSVLGGGQSITYSGTHPTTAERILALEKTVREIKQKRASGQPLKPNRK